MREKTLWWSVVSLLRLLPARSRCYLGRAAPSLGHAPPRVSLRKAEIASITTQTNFAGFYDRLRAIREYHAKFPETAAVTALELEGASAGGSADGGFGGGSVEFAAPAPVIHFSGEENFGRHLDMHALHERALNMPDQVRALGGSLSAWQKRQWWGVPTAAAYFSNRHSAPPSKAPTLIFGRLLETCCTTFP